MFTQMDQSKRHVARWVEFLYLVEFDWEGQPDRLIGLYVSEVKKLIGGLEKWLVDREDFEMEVE
jgi:hypothetical protein